MEPRNHSGASARVLALAAGGLFGAFAFAPAAALAQSGMPDEIIVTAQKREQNLKEVPIAVTALQGAYLADRAITSVDNLNALAPGLVVSPTPTQPNNAQISIRGSVQQNGSIVLDPSVGLYLDGVYIGKAQGSIFDINDLERVEVLRGPQGTLYGRNTLAGAINFITSKPSDVYRGSLEAGYGNFNAVTLKGMVNIPITDKLFAKVSASSFTRDGVTKLVPDPIDIFGTPLGEIANGGIAPSPFGNEAKKAASARVTARTSLASCAIWRPTTSRWIICSTTARPRASRIQANCNPSIPMGSSARIAPSVRPAFRRISICSRNTPTPRSTTCSRATRRLCGGMASSPAGILVTSR